MVKSREERLAQNRARYRKDIERSRAYSREWRLKNLEKERARVRKYGATNKERRDLWRRNNSELVADVGYTAHLRRKFGLSREVYESMYTTQERKCAICGSDDTGQNARRMSVDHNHVTRAVRGLLCGSCNRAIGLLKEDPAIIRNAALYLENPPFSIPMKTS